MSRESSPLPIVLVLLFVLLILSNGQTPWSPPDTPTAKAFLVLIVEETAERTPELADLLLSAELRAAVTGLGHRWRVVDQHAIEWDGQPARVLGPWRELPALSAGQSRALPWVLFVSSDGRVLYEGPLPRSAGEVVELVRRHTAI